MAQHPKKQTYSAPSIVFGIKYMRVLSFAVWLQVNKQISTATVLGSAAMRRAFALWIG
jgi:hypothetical protein